MKTFEPKLIPTLKSYSGKQLVSDIIAGIIVAIIALPLSIALAIASGVSPEKGLYTAIVAGFVIAALGGSRVNISGPTAAFATIVAGIVAEFGISGLTIATIMAGILLVILGLLRCGSLIKYIPCTITTGFTSGIAVTILIGQIKDFLGLTFGPGVAPIETTEKVEAIVHSFGTLNWQALVVGCISLAILIILPKIKYVNKIPPSLIAVIVGIVIVKFTPLTCNTIGDLYTITRTPPMPSLPAFELSTVTKLFSSAVTIAVLAAIESLLSCVVSDGMIGDKHNSNTELIAQGVGNIFSGIFGGIPATGAIARTAANVKNGGRSPIAGMVHAVFLFLILILLMPYAAWIPMPVIAAILFMVAYNMSEWRTFVHLCKTAPLADILVLVLTFVLTVVFDLVVAIAAGIAVSALLFMKRMSDVTEIETKEEDEKVTYLVTGPMFFAASDKMNFVLPAAAKTVTFDLSGVPTMDATAAKNVCALAAKAKKQDAKLTFVGVQSQPEKVLRKNGFTDDAFVK
ncbi:MAG: SulP family inorganic anion transporter [Clostridia bacterium]|nr:SulP family inorganic anion transporter [Clostridia bacterium]